MPEPNPDDIRTALRAFVGEKFVGREQALLLKDDSPLYIDSIDFLDLIFFIENRFGIEFQSRDIDRHQFRSVAQMEEAIRTKLEQRNGI